MKAQVLRILACLALLWPGWAPAALKTKTQLLLAADSARPGDTVLAALRLTMAPRWHTYWAFGGDGGNPTTLDWQLPPGLSAGPIQWPLPEKIETGGLYNYVYHEEVFLIIPLTLAKDAPAGTVELKAKASWLECEQSCVPGSRDVSATLTIGPEAKPSADASAIAAWLKKVPPPAEPPPAKAVWQKPGDKQRAVIIEWQTAAPLKSPDFFPLCDDKWEMAGETKVLANDKGLVRLEKTVRKMGANWPEKLPGVLVGENDQGQRIGLQVTLAPAEPGQAKPAVTPAPAPASQNPPPTASQPAPLTAGKFIGMLWFAFLGGLILNIMPCVLPVISLKILGFVNQSRETPGRVRALGLVYAVGVLASFLVLAAVVIGVKSAGQAASWGMQYQNTSFVMLMTILVLLVALNLLGTFEVTLGGNAFDSASQLASREGYSGAFFNGILATALATPCTAPFLGAALGFAFTQSAPVILVVFLTIGLGLAAPYVLLSCNPAWLRLLPKPGAWMEKFKKLMAFPMLATAVWLSTQLTEAFGPGSELWTGLWLVVVALVAWIYGEFVQRGSARRGLAAGIALALLLGAYFYILEAQLHWRTLAPSARAVAHAPNSPDAIAWQPWSPEAVAAARAAGHPVIVDFTASWCLTCRVNYKTSIDIPEVRQKLKAINAAALLEDSRVKDAQVVAELNRHGRAGVPLVLIYPANPAQQPIVLPEVLTPGIVLSALDKAANN